MYKAQRWDGAKLKICCHLLESIKHYFQLNLSETEDKCRATSGSKILSITICFQKWFHLLSVEKQSKAIWPYVKK